MREAPATVRRADLPAAPPPGRPTAAVAETSPNATAPTADRPHDPARALDAEARFWAGNQRALPDGDPRRGRGASAGEGGDAPGVTVNAEVARRALGTPGNQRVMPDGGETRVLADRPDVVAAHREGAARGEIPMSPHYSAPGADSSSYRVDLGDGGVGHRVDTGASVTTPSVAPGQANPHVMVTTGLAGCSGVATRSVGPTGERLSLAHVYNEDGGAGQLRALHAEVHREIMRGSTDIDTVMRVAPHHTEDGFPAPSGGRVDDATVSASTREALATELRRSLRTPADTPLRHVSVEGEHVVVRDAAGAVVSRVHVEVAVAPVDAHGEPVHQQMSASSDGVVLRNGSAADGEATTRGWGPRAPSSAHAPAAGRPSPNPS